MSARALVPQPPAIAAWLAFLAWAVSFGDLNACITRDQQRLVTIAVAVLTVLAVVSILGRRGAPVARLLWIDALVHFVPLALFAVVGTKVLDSSSLATSSEFIPDDRPRTAATRPSATPATATHRPTDLLKLRYDPFLAGGAVELVGRIGRVPVAGRRKGQPVMMRTVLYRHLITCCAADALPIYADLSAVPADAPIDRWLRLRGIADTRHAGGQTPVISVESWEALAEPEEPYLFRDIEPLPEEFELPRPPGAKPPGML